MKTLDPNHPVRHAVVAIEPLECPRGPLAPADADYWPSCPVLAPAGENDGDGSCCPDVVLMHRWAGRTSEGMPAGVERAAVTVFFQTDPASARAALAAAADAIPLADVDRSAVQAARTKLLIGRSVSDVRPSEPSVVEVGRDAYQPAVPWTVAIGWPGAACLAELAVR